MKNLHKLFYQRKTLIMILLQFQTVLHPYNCVLLRRESKGIEPIRDRSSITSAKRWVGGVRKWQFLLIYSTIYADVGGWVGLKKPKTC
jgi:hypothetical protein